MASAHDVAKYILEKRGAMSAMKLEKLVYYSQAWSLVWDEAPLFGEEIEAWANGPVVRELYDKHRGQYSVSVWPTGDIASLSDNQKDTIDIVLDFYGGFNAQQLSDLTHRESPWREARRNVPEGEPCDNVISIASMAEYYSSL